MTAQQQSKKTELWTKILSGAITLCTAAIIWFGSYQVKMYNAWVMQPQINQQQTAAILNIISDIKEIKKSQEELRNEQTKYSGRLFHLEAIMPNKNQFKIQ